MSNILGKFIFFGWPTVRKSFIPTASIAFDKEDDCVRAAQHWAKVSNGHTACYCVQNGTVGGRPFASFWQEDVVFPRYQYAGMSR